MGFFDSIGKAAGTIFNPGGILTGTDVGMDVLTGGAVSNAKSVSETNEAQKALASEQTAFQERMSNSAYQRAVEDMRKAGLNPALAYQNGGASAPSGAMATLTAPRKGDIGAGLGNTAKSIATMAPQIDNTKSQTDLNKANAQVADVSAQKITANAKESETNTRLSEEQIKKTKAETRSAKANAKIREAEAPAAQARSKFDEKAATWDSVMDRVEQGFGTAGSAFRSFFKGSAPRPGSNRRLP